MSFTLRTPRLYPALHQVSRSFTTGRSTLIGAASSDSPPKQPGIQRPDSVPGSESSQHEHKTGEDHPAKQPDNGPEPTRSTGIKSENADRTEGKGKSRAEREGGGS